MLYIVATPIGNLQDITFRGITILSEVDLIACEDTRETRKILSKYDIHTRYISCHAHNEKYVFETKLLPLLQQGKDVALVSDSGTPAVSDPGAYVVEEAYKHEIPVCPIPGASSVTTIMSVSGLHGKGFWFEGFLGRKSSQRKARITELLTRNEAFILLESPYRVLKLLAEIADIDNTRDILFGRELTKKFESLQKMNVSVLLDTWNQSEKQVKGECILLVYPIKK